jgi:hypothetical protein
MDLRQTMGESRISGGLSLGRSAVLGLACAVLLCPGFAIAQARSPAADKGGAKGLAGTIVEYEESRGRGILYHEAVGGLVTNAPPAPVEKANGAAVAKEAAPKAVAAKTNTAKGPVEAAANGATPLRAPQRPAAPPQGVAMRR